jgi:hypothetical protein
MWDFIVNFLKSNPIAVFSVFISIAALVFSYLSWLKTRTATLYSDIDGRYMELLKLGITNPKFVDPAYTAEYQTRFKDDDLLSYGRYAFAAWNIVETIVDRRGNNDLDETWKPVIREENWLHRKWLNDKDNQHKFKKDFWKFIIRHPAVVPCPDCQDLPDNSRCPRCTEIQNMAWSNKEIPINATVKAGIGPISS